MDFRLHVLFLAAIITTVLVIQVEGFNYCIFYQQRCNVTTPLINNIVYCGSDGKKYQGVCKFFQGTCKHNITMTATGANCEHKIVHHTPRPPTSPRPPTHFEIKLFDNIKRGIDHRLELSKSKGISPAKAKPIYSKQDHTKKIYTRNPDCWAYGLDLTSISPWNSNHGIRKAGTLVTRRHLLWARHYNIPVGTTMRFVTLNNTVIERKIASIKFVNHSSHGHERFWGRDIVVGMLDHDVPNTIAFAKVMPKELSEFRPNRDTMLPVLSTDFQEHAIVTDFNYYRNTGIGLRTPAVGTLEHDYYERKIGGDSGNPSFFVINNELALLFVFTSGGAGGGTSINHFFDEINKLMKAEGGGYQLTPIDLSKFEDSDHHIPHVIG